MAKRNKAAASKSITDGGGKNKSTASSRAKTTGTQIKAAVSQEKNTRRRNKKTVESVPLSEVNGDCGNGKLRCKSLVIDGTKYRTRLNYKFENRRSWEYPDPRKVTSSIPGTIIKIFVEEGQEVKMGDQMMILEAMKMKNRIIFHADGNVKSIYVKEGERIPKDFLILEMK